MFIYTMTTHIWGQLRGNLVKAIFLRTKLWLKLLIRKTFYIFIHFLFYSEKKKTKTKQNNISELVAASPLYNPCSIW